MGPPKGDDSPMEGSAMFPARKKSGMAAYVSRQPRTAIVKRIKTVAAVALVKRAASKLPVAKRAPREANASRHS